MSFLSRLRRIFRVAPSVVATSFAPRYDYESLVRSSLLSSDPRIASNTVSAALHPILQMTDRLPGTGTTHETQMSVFHAMRQYLPTLDAAFKNRRTLEGELHVKSQDEGLQAYLEDWAESIRVGRINDTGSTIGLLRWINIMCDAADEYGLAVGEGVLTNDNRDIDRLVMPNMRTISTADLDDDDLYEIYQTQNGQRQRIDDNINVFTFAFHASSETTWPEPLAWSTIKTTEIVLRMYEAVNNAWWRYGDPSGLYAIEYDVDAAPAIENVTLSDGTSVAAPVSLTRLKTAIETVMAARRSGQVGDAFLSIEGGRLKNEILGDVNQSLVQFFGEHASRLDSMIVTHSECPDWMFPNVERSGDGLGSLLSQNQSIIASRAARRRAHAKKRLAIEMLRLLLLVRGEARYMNAFDVETDIISIIDEEILAKARETNASAEERMASVASLIFDAETGERIFTGEAEQYLVDRGAYSPPNS
jgi:hypothetical protein